MLKSIYEYSNPNQFFKDRWSDLKRKRPELSVRSLANFLDLNSHGSIHQMLSGKRKIGQAYIPKISQYLGLEDKERLYFDILVRFSRANTVEETNFYLETMKELKPKEVPSMEILNNYEIQREPLYFFIMELAELEELVNDHVYIAKKMVLKYSSFEIKGAISFLIENGFLIQNSQNVLKKLHKHLYSKQDKRNLALVQYHQKLSSLAHYAVEKQNIHEREFNGSAFNIDTNSLLMIKEDIRDFLASMIKKYESPSLEGNATYQFNLQFFKVLEK